MNTLQLYNRVAFSTRMKMQRKNSYKILQDLIILDKILSDYIRSYVLTYDLTFLHKIL